MHPRGKYLPSINPLACCCCIASWDTEPVLENIILYTEQMHDNIDKICL